MFITSLVEFFICWCTFLHMSGADSCNVVFQSKLAARTDCFTTFGDCGFDNLQARHPTLYNKTGWKRDPPSDIKLTSFCEPNSLGVNQSGINVQWNLPDSQSAAGIAGYELRVEGDPPNFRCMVVVLEEKATPTNIHLVLNSTVFPVRRNHNYVIVLHSLPRANNSVEESKHVLSMNCKRGSSSSNWAPAGHNYSYRWPEKLLVVWFQAPPSQFNITSFQLDLFPDDNGRTQNSKISNKTEVEFVDVEPGNYTLYMQPYNKNPHDRKLCVCRDDENRCKSCKLSVWHIEVKIPKKSASKASKGQGHELVVGVSFASVGMVILTFLLYRFLAKRFGIECIIGKGKKGKKDDILHVVCIDVSSTGREALKLRFILENDLNTAIKFKRVKSMTDTDLSAGMSSVWKKWKIGASFTDCGSHVVSNKSGISGNKSDISAKILICLLISNSDLENVSEMLSKVLSNIPKKGKLRVQICAVSFSDGFAFSQCTSVKCFALNVDQHKFVNAVKNAFPKKTDQNASVVYTNGTTNPILTTCNKNSDLYVALRKTQTENCCGVSEHKDEIINNPTPEVMYLGISEQRRERYVSNDSGRGGSVLSYKPGQLADDHTGLWHETNAIPYEMEYQAQPNGKWGNRNKYHPTESGCPSCDISFYPPDPSVISENDFDPDAIDSNCGNNRAHAYSKNPDRKCLNCMNGLTKTNANSMDSIMEKMAQINERSAQILKKDCKPGEVHSVWEGHV